MPRAAFLTSNITIACTQTAGAGGVGGKTELYIIPQDRPFADLCAGEARQTEAARCLTARYGQIDRILAIQSDAQAYKQAGNSVTANVIEAIGRRIRMAMWKRRRQRLCYGGAPERQYCPRTAVEAHAKL